MNRRIRKYLVMALLTVGSLFVICDPLFSASGGGYFKRADDFRPMIPIKVLEKIKVPKGYHEGLYLEGGNIWVNNGQGIKTWVIELSSGNLVSEIAPIATFTEGITSISPGKYWVTDWDSRKMHLVKIKENKMIEESNMSLAPAHPTGIVWTGSHLYVITWTRGAGTKYHLIKMDAEGNMIGKYRIREIQEPSQLAWDGKDLWISSWFNRRIYRVDVNTLELKGYFRSGVKAATGIVWDGKCFWLTGTKADLRRVELLRSN